MHTSSKDSFFMPNGLMESFHGTLQNSMRRKVDIWQSLLDSNEDCQVSFFAQILFCFIQSGTLASSNPTPWPLTNNRFPPLVQPSDDNEVESVAVSAVAKNRVLNLAELSNSSDDKEFKQLAQKLKVGLKKCNPSSLGRYVELTIVSRVWCLCRHGKGALATRRILYEYAIVFGVCWIVEYAIFESDCNLSAINCGFPFARALWMLDHQRFARQCVE
jgi:hypothetical protein